MSTRGIFKIFFGMAFIVVCLIAGFIIHLASPAFSEDLLIITPYQFVATLEPLVEHKNSTSMPTLMIALESVYADTRFNGTDAPEEIKRAIEYYVRNNHINYVMLVGDCNKFPVRWQFGHLFDGNGDFIHTPFHLYVPSDYYYADIYDGSGGFNDWDAEPDGYYGKIYITDINPDGIDFQPDVAVARVPAQNIRQLENYVTKVIRYEHKTFGQAWFRRALLIQNSFTDDITTKENIGAHFSAMGYGVTRFYSNMDPNFYTGPSNGIPVAANITQKLNEGFGFISQTWHGWYGGWYDFGDEFGPPVETSNGDMMYDTGNLIMHDPNNAYRLPIIYSGACDSSKFAMTPPFIINYTTEDGWDFNRPISGAQLGRGPDPNTPEQFGIYPRPAPLQVRYNNYSLAEAFLMESLDGAIAYYGNMETGEDVHRVLDESFFEAYNPSITNILGDMWLYAIERFVIENEVDTLTPDANSVWPMIILHGPSRTILFGDPSLRVGGIPFLRDVSPPVTSDNIPSGWTNENVVSLSATDYGSPASGVRETMHRVDGNITADGPWHKGKHISIGSNGIHTIQYYSEDFLENRENPPELATLRLDRVSPVTEVLLDGNMPAIVVGTPGTVSGCPWAGSFNGNVTVSFSATDDRSDVAATFYRLRGSTHSQPYTTPITIRACDYVTVETIRYKSIDNAGNREAEKCIFVSITGNGWLGRMREQVRILAALKEIISFRMRKELDLPFTPLEMSIEYALQPQQGEPNWQYLGTDYDLTDGGEVLWDTTKIVDGNYFIRTTIQGVQNLAKANEEQAQTDTTYQEQNRAQVCNIPASSYIFNLFAADRAQPGDAIEYTLTFSNKLSNSIYNLAITCDMDIELFSAIELKDNGQTDKNGIPFWYVKELKAGDTVTVHAVAHISPNIAPNTLITCQALLNADNIPMLISDDPNTQEKDDYTATTITPLEGKIAGTVKEDIYGSPVQSAVTITGPESMNIITNSNGSYTFSNLPPGDYTVSIMPTGYIYYLPEGSQTVNLEGTGETVYANFIVRAKDDGIRESINTDDENDGLPDTHVINLSPGWNAVGLAVEYASALTSQGLCEQIASQGGAIMEADRFQQGAWEGHLCSLPFNMFTLSSGQGIFIKMETAGTWTQTGIDIPSPLALNLNIGWNFIALPLWAEGLFDAQRLIDEINSQGTCCTEIDRFSGGVWEAHIDGQEINNFPVLPGHGYALKCSSASTVMIEKGVTEATITLQQGTANYQGGKDTFITTLWDADDNLGGNDYLECYKDDVERHRILIYFDLTGFIPADANISEARLELYNFNGEWDDNPQEISAYRMTADWVEGTGTGAAIFDEPPDQSGAYWGHSGYTPWTGGVFDPALLDRVMFAGRPGASSEGDTWVSWDITSAVLSWHGGSALNYGIMLKGDAAGEYSGFMFHSDEYPDASLRPRLIIAYTTAGGAISNHDPACDAGTYNAKEEGQRVDLTGTASDIDNDALAFSWTWVSGPAITLYNNKTLTPYFNAPEVSAPGATVTVRLTVTDGRGGTCHDDASILITEPSAGEAIIIDHTCIDLSQVPDVWIETARSTLRIWYGHTSHGSQITSGIDAMRDSLYAFGTEAGALSYHELEGADLGHEGDLSWRNLTVAQLESPGNDRNVVMWSWCGGVSDNTEAGINTYLNAMNQLEQNYPGVTFIYMTGHLDGSGETGNLNLRNNQIRNYCRTNNKILFDFADIESYDPSGSYFLNRGADDGCYYDGTTRNWAEEWCATHTGECASYECAHSHSLNCDLKARAFWWMMARIAGWEPGLMAELLQPEDLVYFGAFRLPDRIEGSPDAEGWEYGGQALAYRPDGDPGGSGDGYPGSLFGSGHGVWNYIAEISIPAPSLSRNLDDLNKASTIQGFHDVQGGLFNPLDELPRVGLEYLPPQGAQTSAKLYLSWGQHFQFEDGASYIPSHAWCDIDLSNPNTKGAWWIGADFASVAKGAMESYTPQPYATLDLDERLFLNVNADPGTLGAGAQRKYRIGATAYDRERGFLYIIERFADGPKPVIHVWGISAAGAHSTNS